MFVSGLNAIDNFFIFALLLWFHEVTAAKEQKEKI